MGKQAPPVIEKMSIENLNCMRQAMCHVAPSTDEELYHYIYGVLSLTPRWASDTDERTPFKVLSDAYFGRIERGTLRPSLAGILVEIEGYISGNEEWIPFE